MSLIHRCPTLLALCAVIVGMVTMFEWWVPVLVLGGLSLLFFREARKAERLGGM